MYCCNLFNQFFWFLTLVYYFTSFTCSFTDRSTEVQAAQTKIRNLLEKCSIQQESSQSSQHSNGESSPDLINKLTTALHHNNKCKETACFPVNLIN